MNNLFNFFLDISRIRLLIVVLAAVASVLMVYVWLSQPVDMALSVQKKPIQVRLMAMKLSSEGFHVDLQDTASQEKFEDVRVSALCPAGQGNALYKIISVEKTQIYHVQRDEKEIKFQGLYEALCTTGQKPNQALQGEKFPGTPSTQRAKVQ